MAIRLPGARATWVAGAALLLLVAMQVRASEPAATALRQRFDSTVLPFLKTNCVSCHRADKAKGQVTLHDLSIDPKDKQAVGTWLQVLEQLEVGAMPPEDRPQPKADAREQVTAWIQEHLTAAGKGFELKAKLLAPEFGNRVNHDLLFNGTIRDMPASPSRLWRISPGIFAAKGYQTGPAPRAEPLAFSTKTDGIRDYAAQEIVGEAAFLSLMLAFDDIISKQMHGDKADGGNPSFKSIAEANGPPSREAMEKVIREEFQRAFSRPAASEELARYLAFLMKNIQQSNNESGLKITVMAIWLAPEAVYRMELGLGKSDEFGRRMLSPREIAFALSYALTDAPPSKSPILKEALEKNQLTSKTDVEKVVRRMLADGAPPTQHRISDPIHNLRSHGKKGYAYYPRVVRFFEEFFEYQRVESVFKDKKRGAYNPRGLAGSTEMTIAEIVNDDRRVFEELLTSSRFNDSRERLLRLLEDDHREKMKTLPESRKAEAVKRYEKLRLEIPARPINETFRMGVLTDPSWLMVHSKCTENDPVHRGKWIRERLLAGAVPDLPIGVQAQIPDDHDRTLRQRFEVVQQDACWKCHKHMNPLGMPFESLDDFGRLRTGLYFDRKKNAFLEQPEWDRLATKKDAGIVVHPVDATGFLSGTGDPALDGEVKDAFDLVQRLARSIRVRQSIIRHAFRYWMGRNETLSDSRTLIAADQAYVKSGGKFSEVLVALLCSDSFLYRR